ncbi:chaplin [Streptomyces sp. NPDC054838]
MALAAGALVVGGASAASADAHAEGLAVGSPGLLSGNVVQVPIHIPINACGNSVNVIGLLNPAAGNVCVNS